ncbi:unnamed protein product [Meganyctiphanes norvegica]|uniref:Uncharacterized protein n=1 Tax=Meganyctiphanes norvegica TaxID=48144 RepID=A0AAV2QTX5_MEGNR
MAIKGIRARLDKETAKRSTDLTDVEIYCVSTAYTGTVESLLSENWDPCDPLPSPGSSKSDGNPENTENNNLQDSNHATTLGDSPDSSTYHIIIGSSTAILLIIVIIITAVVCLKKRKNKDKQSVDDLPLPNSGAGMGTRHDSENSLYGVVGGTTEPQEPNRRSRHDSENSLYGAVM